MATHKKDWLFISQQRAIEQGYIAKKDPEAFGGKVYIKNGFKWVHSINLLKFSLNLEDDSDLVELGYNVKDYYLFNSDEPAEFVIQAKYEMLQIFDDNFSDFPEGKMYLGDGMYLDEDGNIDGDWNR